MKLKAKLFLKYAKQAMTNSGTPYLIFQVGLPGQKYYWNTVVYSNTAIQLIKQLPDLQDIYITDLRLNWLEAYDNYEARPQIVIRDFVVCEAKEKDAKLNRSAPPQAQIEDERPWELNMDDLNNQVLNNTDNAVVVQYTRDMWDQDVAFLNNDYLSIAKFQQQMLDASYITPEEFVKLGVPLYYAMTTEQLQELNSADSNWWENEAKAEALIANQQMPPEQEQQEVQTNDLSDYDQ